jgi:undecaprenyl-diphosphatase
LLVGGLILLFVDRWFNHGDINNTDDITYGTAFKIGLFQCISMIPGVSRSASTIVGGMSQKLSRKTAAEFSFFLAVPTMFGATAKKLFDFYQNGFVINQEQVNLLIIGNLVAFIVAMLAIRYFITFLQSRGFRIFGWYRIIVGGIILILLLSGYDLKVI